MKVTAGVMLILYCQLLIAGQIQMATGLIHGGISNDVPEAVSARQEGMPEFINSMVNLVVSIDSRSRLHIPDCGECNQTELMYKEADYRDEEYPSCSLFFTPGFSGIEDSINRIEEPCNFYFSPGVYHFNKAMVLKSQHIYLNHNPVYGKDTAEYWLMLSSVLYCTMILYSGEPDKSFSCQGPGFWSSARGHKAVLLWADHVVQNQGFTLSLDEYSSVSDAVLNLDTVSLPENPSWSGTEWIKNSGFSGKAVHFVDSNIGTIVGKSVGKSGERTVPHNGDRDSSGQQTGATKEEKKGEKPAGKRLSIASSTSSESTMGAGGAGKPPERPVTFHDYIGGKFEDGRLAKLLQYLLGYILGYRDVEDFKRRLILVVSYLSHADTGGPGSWNTKMANTFSYHFGVLHSKAETVFSSLDEVWLERQLGHPAEYWSLRETIIEIMIAAVLSDWRDRDPESRVPAVTISVNTRLLLHSAGGYGFNGVYALLAADSQTGEHTVAASGISDSEKPEDVILELFGRYFDEQDINRLSEETLSLLQALSQILAGMNDFNQFGNMLDISGVHVEASVNGMMSRQQAFSTLVRFFTAYIKKGESYKNFVQILAKTDDWMFASIARRLKSGEICLLQSSLQEYASIATLTDLPDGSTGRNTPMNEGELLERSLAAFLQAYQPASAQKIPLSPEMIQWLADALQPSEVSALIEQAGLRTPDSGLTGKALLESFLQMYFQLDQADLHTLAAALVSVLGPGARLFYESLSDPDGKKSRADDFLPSLEQKEQ